GVCVMSEQKQLTVGVTGMTCAACSSRIEKVLSKMDGVDAQVNLTTEKANIDYNSEITSVEEITTKIEKLGYGVETEKTELDRSEEHTSELQSRFDIVCRLL